MPASSTIQGGRVNTLDNGSIHDVVSGLLSSHCDLFDDESVVVVPDVHYPYHPSTGLVSNPSVVEAVIAELQPRASDVVIGCRAAPVVGTETVVRVLGYPHMADRRGVEIIDLGEADTVSRPIGLREGAGELALPTPYVDATIVVVPTVRTDHMAGMALGMATLARTVDPEASTTEGVWTVVSQCTPTVTLLDGSYTFLGEPRSSGFFLSSDDIVAIDAAVAGAVGRTPTYLDARSVQELRAVYPVEGLSLQSVVADLPSSDFEPAGQPAGMMRTAYRAYARLAGDALPPQFL